MAHDLFVLGIPFTEKLVRTVGVYGFLLVGLRLAGKRELGQLNPFDVGGALTFVPRAPTDDERRHRELLRHLAALREGQASLASRLEALEHAR